MQVKGIRRLDLNVSPITWLELLGAHDVDHAIDFWRIRLAASDRNTVLNGIHQHAHASPNLGLQALRADLRGALHETDPALFLHFLRDVTAKLVGRRAL